MNIIYGDPQHRAGLAESPVWDDAARCWYYIDIPKRQVHRHTLDGAHTEWQLPQTDANDPGALCVCDDGTLIVALRAGLVRFDPATPAGEIAPSIWLAAPYDTATMRFNDGGVDAQGRFWIGTLYAPKTHAGASLFCLDKGVLHAVVGELAAAAPHNSWGVTTSNGWAVDGAHLYHADTQAHAVYRYRFDANAPVAAALSNRETFYQTATQAESAAQNIAYQGRPDGAAIDSAGNYWNAQFEGGQVIQFSASGEILQRVQLPARCPTMVSFGGEDLKTLFITTTGNRPEEELADYPANGFILGVPVEVAGLPTRRYRNS
ncbi:MAG: SMP-30/gluconolactonase/LRE family protein [Formosimonas sp.]